MTYVYAVYECRAFNIPGLVRVYKTREVAQAVVEDMTNKLKSYDRPEYDDWGLCQGIEYKVIKLKVY